MPSNELNYEASLFRMTLRGYLNVSLFAPPVVSDVSLGKSIHHFISFDSLCMINSLDSSSHLKLNAFIPS